MFCSNWYIHATLLVALACATSACSRPSSQLGDRARGKLAEGTGRASVDPADVPAEDRSIVAAPPTAAEEATPPVVTETAEVGRYSAAVYGARWCRPCAELHKTVLRLQSAGAWIEYRDLDKNPTPFVTALPTVFLYRDDLPVASAVGLPDCKTLLERYFDSD